MKRLECRGAKGCRSVKGETCMLFMPDDVVGCRWARLGEGESPDFVAG